MAARLGDVELAKELKTAQGALEPEACRALEEEARRRSKPRRSPILVTTPTLHRPIRRVLGIVGGEYVLGVNLFHEVLAGIRDTVGGRSATIQAALREGRTALLDELRADAARLHADAVVGVAFTLSEWSGQNKSMLILMASGTAVELISDAPDS
jgi:uncharacterized protein YbjQ (UPF0145 family)